jgi:hypothetical protein
VKELQATNPFEKNNALASDLLHNHRGKMVAIRKATRAGATTSLLKRAFELGQKTVIIVPFIKIFDQTVNEALKFVNKGSSPRVARIKANKEMCQKTAQELKKYPKLEKLGFSHRGNCKNCSNNNPSDCEFQRVMKVGERDITMKTTSLRAFHYLFISILTLLKRLKYPN